MKDVFFFISAHSLLSIIWFFFLILMIFFIYRTLFFRFKIIENVRAVELINKNNAVVIDTRSLELYNKGHIVNAIYLPFEQICFKKIQELQLLKSIPIILIVHSMDNYNKYIKKFIKYGLSDVYFLKNGMDSWHSESLPVILTKKK